MKLQKALQTMDLEPLDLVKCVEIQRNLVTLRFKDNIIERFDRHIVKLLINNVD